MIPCIADDNSWALSFGRGMDIVVSPTCKSRGPVEAEREGRGNGVSSCENRIEG
jgi:hypothetical protein